MGIRAIAVRDRPAAQGASLLAYRSRPDLWTPLSDDRRLLGLKVVLLSLIVLVTLALEVPL